MDKTGSKNFPYFYLFPEMATILGFVSVLRDVCVCVHITYTHAGKCM